MQQMIKNTICALLLLTTLPLRSQEKHDNVWIMGFGSTVNNPATYIGGNWLDFSSGSPNLQFFNLPNRFDMSNPCLMSDTEGRLQFYTNGCRAMNYLHEEIPGSAPLNPGRFYDYECVNGSRDSYDSGTSMTALPRPGHPGRYLIFHMAYDFLPTGNHFTLFYSEVDMSLNGGKGGMRSSNNVLQSGNVSKCVGTVRHGNGRDWWVCIVDGYYNVYHLYQVTPDSIHGPFVQDWRAHWQSEHLKSGGITLRFSPDGRKLLRTAMTESQPSFFLYDFDRCNGTLSNQKRVHLPDPLLSVPSAEFSPNSRFIYHQEHQSKLYQYDTWATDIAASATLVGEYDGFRDDRGFSTGFFHMAAAPDGKIYMATAGGTRYLHTMHAPNEPGLACDFRQHDFPLVAYMDLFLPNFPNYRLYDAAGALCDTLGIDGPQQPTRPNDLVRVRIAPNPASDFVVVQLLGPLSPSTLRVYNMLGQLLYEDKLSGASTVASIPVHDWPSGTYVVELLQPGLPRWAERAVVVHR
jgi:hypothetical protein